MASDNLRQVGRYMRHAGRQADLAMKRVTNKVPKRERARDTVSALFPFQFIVNSEGEGDKVSIDINFNKPPPDDCSAECIATACEDFQLSGIGGYSLTTTNPYEVGSIRIYSEGSTLPLAQFVEENPSGGQVYVQVQSDIETIVICYTYIVC